MRFAVVMRMGAMSSSLGVRIVDGELIPLGAVLVLGLAPADWNEIMRASGTN